MATRTEDLKGRLSIDDTAWKAGLQDAATKFRGFAAGIGRNLSSAFSGGMASLKGFAASIGGVFQGITGAIGGAIQALGIGGLFSTAGIIAGIKNIADLGGELSDVSARTGIAVDSLVLLREQFRQGGVDVGQVTNYIRRMNEALLDQKKGGVFEAMGLDQASLQRAKTEEAFNAILSGIRRVQGVANQQAALSDIFGARQGVQLMTLVVDESSFQKAQKMIGGMAAEMDKNADDFDRISDNLFEAIPVKMQGLFAGFTGGIVEELTAVTNWFEGLDLVPVGRNLGRQLSWAWQTLTGLVQEGTIWEFAGLRLKQGFMVAVSWLYNALTETLKAVFSKHNAQAFQTFFQGIAMYLGGALQSAIAEAVAGIPFLGVSESITGKQRAEGASKMGYGKDVMGAALGLAGDMAPQTLKDIGAALTNMQTVPLFQAEMDRSNARMAEIIAGATARAGVSGTSPIAQAGGIGAALTPGTYREATEQEKGLQMLTKMLKEDLASGNAEQIAKAERMIEILGGIEGRLGALEVR